jgi:UDP-GlcNAc3NAcA epimerase
MITIIVGNRPQFIKLAPLSRALAARDLPFEIIHSGQHHDFDMSASFFEDLSLPAPHKKLLVTQSAHGAMTAEILTGVEAELQNRRTRGVVVFGDTNTTLAGALGAAKLGIPVAHIEAGPRTQRFDAPEEINRRVTDQLSTFCFCPDRASLANLRAEGLGDRAAWVGDIMLDAFRIFSADPQTHLEPALAAFIKNHGDFGIFTIHRAHNTDTQVAIQEMVAFLSACPLPMVFPVHPRTSAALKKYGLWEQVSALSKVCLVNPLGYLHMLELIRRCSLVFTDSGGLQKEAFFGGKQSILFDNASPWPELHSSQWALSIGGFDKVCAAEITAKMANLPAPVALESSFGDGHASERIISILSDAKWF